MMNKSSLSHLKFTILSDDRFVRFLNEANETGQPFEIEQKTIDLLEEIIVKFKNFDRFEENNPNIAKGPLNNAFKILFENL